jgi:hypothetical protein
MLARSKHLHVCSEHAGVALEVSYDTDRLYAEVMQHLPPGLELLDCYQAMTAAVETVQELCGIYCS